MQVEKLIDFLQICLREENIEKEKNINSKEKKLFKKDEKYYIQTIQYFYTGKFVEEKDGYIIIDNVSWVADSGRVSESLQRGLDNVTNSEIEVFPKDKLLYIKYDTITAFYKYDFDLPTKTK